MSVRQQEMCASIALCKWGEDERGAGNVKQTWSRLFQVGMSGCRGCSLIFALATFPRMKRSQTNLRGGRGVTAICLLLCRAQVKGADSGSLLFTWIILVNSWRGVPEGRLVSVGVKDGRPNVWMSNRPKKVPFVPFVPHPGVLAFAKITCFCGLHRNWTFPTHAEKRCLSSPLFHYN